MEMSYNFCCICIEECKELEPVIEPDENGVKYSEKLTACDQTQDWDNKTFSLCKSCRDKLTIVYEFIEECKKSDVLRKEKLRQLEEELEKGKAENETFTCYVCEKPFTKKRFLKSHITRIHEVADNKRKSTEKNTEVEEKGNNQTSNPTLLVELNQESRIKNLSDTKNVVKNEFDIGNVEDDDYFSHNNASYVGEEDEKSKLEKMERKKSESFTCEYCGKQFNRHQHWSAHIRSKHTFEKPYKCNICEASFTTSHSLLVHKRNHNNEKPYICNTCGKRFVCSGDLFHHNKIHLNKKEYECIICSKRFNTTSILRTHKIVKHTEPQDWKYVCLLCDRRFPFNSSLSLHMKRHSGVKDHPCYICSKRFFNKTEVSKHILSHSNQKRFKCDMCEDKEYKNKEGLNKHMKIIHDLGFSKRFLCPLCPKRFTFNNKLERHLLIHRGEKPYKCDFCDKKFSDTCYKKTHMLKEHNEQLDEEGNEIKYVDLVPIALNGFV